MTQPFYGSSTADIYQCVISEVYDSMKEVFLDDDVELDVLAQIKKAWEDKVAETCLFDRKPRGQSNFNVAAPQLRSETPVGRFGGVPGVRMLSSVSDYPVANVSSPQVYQVPDLIPDQQFYQLLPNQQTPQLVQSKQEVRYYVQPKPEPRYSGNYGVAPNQVPQNLLPVTQVQYGAQGGITYQTSNGPLRPLQPLQRALLVPQRAVVQQGQGQFADQQQAQPAQSTQQIQRVVYRPLQGQQGQQQYVQQQSVSVPQSGQQHISAGAQFVYVQSSVTPSPPPAEGQGEQKPTIPHTSMYQLDGNACREHVEVKSTRRKTKATERLVTNEDAKRILALLGVLQLDGGGAGMSDSSSDEDDDMCPLRRLADKVGGDGIIEESEQIVEEEALNSDDDDDDDDLGRLFDVENTIICQFEKVHRTRNKWKLNLKDGIMHIEDRDHCFNRANGEAEF